jgi:hypothetical protein
VSATVPFVVGQWVRGAQLYGRERELVAALEPAHRCRWVVGLRRVGKTSLLRELERRAPGQGLLPVLWDLQGVDGAGEATAGLAAAFADAEQALAAHDIAVEEVSGGDAAAMLRRLQRVLAAHGVSLLLLMDEADELSALARAAPGMVEQLWCALGEARTVLATSPRFADGTRAGALAADPLRLTGLGDLGEPLYLGALTDEEACALLRQDQLPPGARPRFDVETVEALRAAAGNHPMLLQLLGRRCLELGDAAAAIARVAADRTLHHLFAVDLDLLAPAEREILHRVARGEAGGWHGAHGEERCGRLQAMGLVCDRDLPHIASELLAGWLRDRAG